MCKGSCKQRKIKGKKMYSHVRPYKILQKVNVNENRKKKETNEEKKKHSLRENNSEKHIKENQKKEELRYDESNRKVINNKYGDNNRRVISQKYYNLGSNHCEKYNKEHSRLEEKVKTQVLLKNKKNVLIPLLKKEVNCLKKKKIVIRHLPPTLSETHFFDSFSNNLKDELDYYYYVNGSVGKNAADDMIHSRMYLSFKDDMKTEEFIRTQNGKFFYDVNGAKYKANVSFAPNQTLIHKNKSDDRNNTIESDAYFLKCCEEMNNSTQPPKKDIDYYDVINVVKENGSIVSPIVLALRNKLRSHKMK